MTLFKYINYGFYKFYLKVLKEGRHSRYLSILALSFCQGVIIKAVINYFYIEYFCSILSIPISLSIYIIIAIINFRYLNVIEFEKNNTFEKPNLIYFGSLVFFILSAFVFFYAPILFETMLNQCR